MSFPSAWRAPTAQAMPYQAYTCQVSPISEVIKMPLTGAPPSNLAAVSLIRAAIADDPDSGV